MIKETKDIKPQRFYSWKESFDETQINSPDYFELDGHEETNYLHYLEEQCSNTKNK